MKKIKLWFRAVFGFSQSEINGFIILSILMVLFLIAPFLYSYIIPKNEYDSSKDDAIVQELLTKASNYKTYKRKSKTNKKAKTKPFVNKKKQHILKSENEEILEPKPNWIPNKYKKEITPIELNSADTTALKQIKGIGSKLSSRIIKYRKRLGGFHNIEQLKEIYGLDTNLISKNKQHFTPINLNLITKINLDTSSVKTLIKHPYINYKKAIAIANYRNQHGNFKSISDLKKIHLLNEMDINKLNPYLLFE